jgi:hypothetical protein
MRIHKSSRTSQSPTKLASRTFSTVVFNSMGEDANVCCPTYKAAPHRAVALPRIYIKRLRRISLHISFKIVPSESSPLLSNNSHGFPRHTKPWPILASINFPTLPRPPPRGVTSIHISSPVPISNFGSKNPPTTPRLHRILLLVAVGA